MPDHRNLLDKPDEHKETPQPPPDHPDEPSDAEPNRQGWEKDVLRRARRALEILKRHFPR